MKMIFLITFLALAYTNSVFAEKIKNFKISIGQNKIPLVCEKLTTDDQKFEDLCEEQRSILSENEVIQGMLKRLNIQEIHLLIYDYHNFPDHIDFGVYEKNGKPFFRYLQNDLGYTYHSIKGDLERFEIYYNTFKRIRKYGVAEISCEHVSQAQCDAGKKRLETFKELNSDNLSKVIFKDHGNIDDYVWECQIEKSVACLNVDEPNVLWKIQIEAIKMMKPLIKELQDLEALVGSRTDINAWGSVYANLDGATMDEVIAKMKSLVSMAIPTIEKIADYLTKECEAAQVEGCNELRKDFETDLIKMRNEMTTIQNEIKELEVLFPPLDTLSVAKLSCIYLTAQTDEQTQKCRDVQEYLNKEYFIRELSKLGIKTVRAQLYDEDQMSDEDYGRVESMGRAKDGALVIDLAYYYEIDRGVLDEGILNYKTDITRDNYGVDVVSCSEELTEEECLKGQKRLMARKVKLKRDYVSGVTAIVLVKDWEYQNYEDGYSDKFFFNINESEDIWELDYIRFEVTNELHNAEYVYVRDLLKNIENPSQDQLDKAYKQGFTYFKKKVSNVKQRFEAACKKIQDVCDERFGDDQLFNSVKEADVSTEEDFSLLFDTIYENI